MVGWTSSKALGRMGREHREDFLDLKRRSDIERVRESAEIARGKYGAPDSVRKYNAELDLLNGRKEKRDIVVVMTTDTVASKPPYHLRELPAAHSANKLVEEVMKPLHQLWMEKGVSSYISVIDPPTVPAVLTPESWPRIRLHPKLSPFYEPHMFVYWDDIGAQADKVDSVWQRAEIYKVERDWEVNVPETVEKWDPAFEKRCLKALEASIAEQIVRFVLANCESELYLLIPNSESKKRIKEKIMEKVSEQRPDLVPKKDPKKKDARTTVDIVGNFIFTDSYRENLNTSKTILNRFVTLLENTPSHKKFKFVDRWKAEYEEERSPFVPHSLLDEILDSYENRREILRYIKENHVRPVHAKSVIDNLSFDIDGKLEPPQLPLLEVRREDAHSSCSEIASAMDEAEFFLRKNGFLPTSRELALRSDAGNVMHAAFYRSAPPHIQVAMERAFILSLVPHRGPAKDKEVRIHFQPDLVLYSRRIGLVPVDIKSGVAPFQNSKARVSHMKQVAGYGWALERIAKQLGVENPAAEYGAVQYLQDPQKRRPVLRKFSIGNGSKPRDVFLGNAADYIGQMWEWQKDPQKFVDDYEKKYLADHQKDERGRRCIAAFELFRQRTSRDFIES